MRYRALSEAGDYTFGQSQANFLIDNAACVAQSILTRLDLWAGEWFLNTSSGTLWLQSVLGRNTKSLYDSVIRARVLATSGVTSIVSYASNLLPTRRLEVTMVVDTQYGPVHIDTVLG